MLSLLLLLLLQPVRVTCHLLLTKPVSDVSLLASLAVTLMTASLVE